MGAKEILIAMNGSGLSLSLVGEVLRATPRERLTDEHRLLIRQHKPELVALLKAMAEPDHQGFFPGGTDSTEQATVPPWGMSETQPATDGTPFDPDFFAERAAIIAHEGGIPREWAEGLAKICTMDRPKDIPQKKWDMVIEVAAIFTGWWANEASRLDWTTEEVFGVHATGPMVRYGSEGLVFSLADEHATLESIDHEKAIIKTQSGAKQIFRRECFNSDRSQLRIIWESTWKP